MTTNVPIATRTLKVTGSDNDQDVEVRIFAPEQAEKTWTCRYEIAWPERLKTMTAHGFDSMQALELALRLIGVELYTSVYHQAGQLIFEKPGGGYGFPVTQGLRDLLVGDDAKAF